MGFLVIFGFYKVPLLTGDYDFELNYSQELDSE